VTVAVSALWLRFGLYWLIAAVGAKHGSRGRQRWHLLYAGFMLAMLGTSLATSISRLIVLAVVGAYFIYSARVEERLMSASFPTAYPAYRARTKMPIPFVL
jgi:hypothetical protein